MYNKKSLKNLKKFSKDNQPKKRGRPKGSVSITNEIKKVLESVVEGSQKQVVQIFATAVVRKAMDGNSAFMKEVMNRVDGKVPDKPEIKRPGEKEVVFKVEYQDQKKLPD